MGTHLRVFLNAAEEQSSIQLRTTTTMPQRVKDCAEVVRLSHQGMHIEDIAIFFTGTVRNE